MNLHVVFRLLLDVYSAGRMSMKTTPYIADEGRFGSLIRKNLVTSTKRLTEELFQVTSHSRAPLLSEELF